MNETKYKGLSSDDWRSGGQGSKLGGASGGMDGGFGGSRLQDDENFDYGSLSKGRGKGVGIGSSLGGKTPSDDAVAATKARIDALRKDGDLGGESPRKADAIPAVSGEPSCTLRLECVSVPQAKAHIDALCKDGGLGGSPRKSDAIPAVSGEPSCTLELEVFQYHQQRPTSGEPS